MKRLFRFKYPKIAVLMLSIISAYFIFRSPTLQNAVSGFGNLGYLGIFISGILFAFGFTTPLAVGFFATLQPENILLASITAGIGALAGDLTIFYAIRLSFMNEFRKLEHTKLFTSVEKEFKRDITVKIRHYLMYIFAGFLIASPLPDEVGVTMLAGLTHIKHLPLAVLSFVLNTIGIFVILSIFQ